MLKKLLHKVIQQYMENYYIEQYHSQLKQIIDARIEEHINIFTSKIIDEQSRPKGNAEHITQHIYTSYNFKNIMEHVAEERIKSLELNVFPSIPKYVGLQSKCLTQQDLESDWNRHWQGELKFPFKYNRKSWEYGFVLQTLYEHGMFGKKGLGMACGVEHLPSYLIHRGCSITAGDKPFDINDAEQAAWSNTKQYTQFKESLFYEHLVDIDTFENNLTLEYVDMNNIPAKFNDSFDFCWSICAMEHLGSIENGIDFLTNTVKLLKPGGISVHTTEYNIFSDRNTIDNMGTVYFTRKHIQEMEERISAAGGYMYPFDPNSGDGFLDRYIDMSPFPHIDIPGIDAVLPHYPFSSSLKVLWNGFPVTCAGLVIKRNK